MGTGVKKMLQKALEEGYAVGSFSARYLTNIGPVLEAAVRQSSPVIVQAVSYTHLDVYKRQAQDLTGRAF